MGSSAGSATGGRARSNRSLSSVTSIAAVSTASAPAAAARGRHLRFASHAHPAATMSGHFTNQVEASRNTNVNGAQRTSSPSADTAPSQLESVSTTPATSRKDTGEGRMSTTTRLAPSAVATIPDGR